MVKLWFLRNRINDLFHIHERRIKKNFFLKYSNSIVYLINQDNHFKIHYVLKVSHNQSTIKELMR